MVAILKVWDKPNFDGHDEEFNDSIPDLRTRAHRLGNWNDEICSLDVKSGEWEVYENVDYGGRKVSLKAGQKGTTDQLDPKVPQNWISSIKKIND